MPHRLVPRPTIGPPPAWRLALGYALILAVTALAYRPALNGTLLWDDDAHVTRTALTSFAGLRRIWFELGATQQYYPLLHSAFWIEHRLWGDSVLGYHLITLLFHGIAACLVVAITRQLIGATRSVETLAGAPWLAGLLFALHPVAVESVAWISEQKNTLSAVFYLTSLLIYLGFDRDRRPGRYALSLGVFLLALMTKTVTATLPATLLVIFWWERGGLRPKRDILPLVPWFIAGISAGLFTAYVEQHYFVQGQIALGTPASDYALGVVGRLLLAGRVVLFYLEKTLWPAGLMFTYPRWTIDPTEPWQYLYPAGALAILIALARLARRHRAPLAGFLIFAGTLFPALGFFNVYPFRFSYVADHFQYLASLGIIVPAAVGVTLIFRQVAQRLSVPADGITRVGSAALVIALEWITSADTRAYRSSESLYRETLTRNPDTWMAHANLGLILAARTDGLPEALTHFEAAARLDPSNGEVHNYLGSALARMPGRQADALAEYETAVRLSPLFPYAHLNLAIALLRIPARSEEGVEHLRTALLLKPDFAQAHFVLGYVDSQRADGARQALAEYAEAVRLNPSYADAQSALAIALSAAPDRMPEAIAHFREAAALAPDSAAAHFNLACAVVAQPQGEAEARQEFATVLRLDPSNTAAQEWLSRLDSRRTRAVAYHSAH